MAAEPPIPIEKLLIRPLLDNLLLFFMDTPLSEELRKHPSYTGLQTKEPALEQHLRVIAKGYTMNWQGEYDILPPLDTELYKAYLIMREFVNTDLEIGLDHRLVGWSNPYN